MEQTNIIELYNPKNASNLTQEQIDTMSKLTDEQIKQLADAYPNNLSSFAYLILYNENAQKQNYPRSTWANLYNLRAKNKAKEYVALTFSSLWRGGDSALRKDVKAIPMAATQDISKQEIENAPGINKTQFQNEGEQEKVNVENILATNTRIQQQGELIPRDAAAAVLSAPGENFDVDAAAATLKTDNQAAAMQDAANVSSPKTKKTK